MAVDMGTAQGYLDLNTTAFMVAINQAIDKMKGLGTEAQIAGKKVDSFADRMSKTGTAFTNVGNKMTSLGTNLTTHVTLPLLGVATAGMKVATDFEKNMSAVKAISGTTGTEFEKLRDKAIDLGAKTAYSSNEVAEAMTEMAKAGWSSQQILDGMSGVLDAAAASGESLGEVSTIVADAITTFGLKAADSTHVADLLTEAANGGTIGIGDLGESFKYIGPVASSMGISIEQTTTAIEAMSKAGIKGSQAGTTLRGLLARLVKPTDKVQAAMDALGLTISNKDGTFKDLNTILFEMRNKMQGLSDSEKGWYAATLAGTEAQSGLLALINMQQVDYDDLSESMSHADGVAKETATTMQDNLSNKIEQLGGSLESLAIRLGDYVIPQLTQLAIKATDLVDKFTNMDEGTQKFILKLLAVAAALGPVIFVIGKLVTSIGSIITGGANLLKFFGIVETTGGGAFAALGSSIAAVVGPVLGVVAAIGGLIALLVLIYNKNENFRAQVNNIVNEISPIIQKIGSDITDLINKLEAGFTPAFEQIKTSFNEFIQGFDESFASLEDAFSQLGTALQPLWNELQPILEIIGKIIGAGLLAYISMVIADLNALISIINPLIKVVSDVITIISDNISLITSLIQGLITGDFTQFSAALQKLLGDTGTIFADMWTVIETFVSNFASGFTANMQNSFAQFGINVQQTFDSAVQAITQFFVNIGNAFVTFFTVTLPNFIQQVKDWFDKLPYNLGVAVGEAIVKLSQFGIQLITFALTKIPEFIADVINFISQLPIKFWTWLVATIVKVSEFGDQLIAKGIELATQFVENIVKWIITLPSRLAEQQPSMKQAGVDLLNALWDGMKSIWKSISDWFESILDKVKDFVKGVKDGMESAKSSTSSATSTSGSHADGLAYVPYNGYVAQLHEGERVLTKNEAKAYNTGSSGDTFIFNSPKNIDAYEANKLFKQTLRLVEEGLA